jgi:hypothetical protein
LSAAIPIAFRDGFGFPFGSTHPADWNLHWALAEDVLRCDVKSKVHHDGKIVGEFESTGNFAEDQAIAQGILREAGLLPRRNSRVQLVENQAEAFAVVAFELFHKTMALKEQGFSYAITCVVNAAFSIELFLKALALKHGTELRGHKLLDLYGALPQAAKDEIGAAADIAIQGYDLDVPVDLASFLGNLNDVYSTWRYAYEGRAQGEVGITHALFLIDSMRLALLSV